MHTSPSPDRVDWHFTTPLALPATFLSSPHDGNIPEPIYNGLPCTDNVPSRHFADQVQASAHADGGAHETDDAAD